MKTHIKLLTGGAVVVALSLLPIAAYASAFQENFDTQNLVLPSSRLPSSTSQDGYLPSTSRGSAYEDVFGCPSGNNAVNFALYRDITAFPDQKIFEYDGRTYCAGQWGSGTVYHWSSGHFHWQVGPKYYPEASAGGFVEAYN